MNLLSPVSKIMTTKLITVSQSDLLNVIKEIFDEHSFHHIPVTEKGKIIGIVSKVDFLSKVYEFAAKENMTGEEVLKVKQVKDIMTTKLAKIESSTRINVALDVFSRNLFHALPIVADDDELVGLITTHDIIQMIAKEPILLSDYNKD